MRKTSCKIIFATANSVAVEQYGGDIESVVKHYFESAAYRRIEKYEFTSMAEVRDIIRARKGLDGYFSLCFLSCAPALVPLPLNTPHPYILTHYRITAKLVASILSNLGTLNIDKSGDSAKYPNMKRRGEEKKRKNEKK